MNIIDRKSSKSVVSLTRIDSLVSANSVQARVTRSVVIGDPHPAFAVGLSGLVAKNAGSVDLAPVTTKSYPEILQWAARNPDGTVVVNPAVPGAPGLHAAARIRRVAPHARIIVVIDQDDHGLATYFTRHGADAVISKLVDVEVFEGLICGARDPQGVHLELDTGERKSFSVDFYEALSGLTKRQVTILTRLKEGRLNKQIAHELGITEATVKHHVSALLATLGFYSRSQLVALINELRISLTLPESNRARSSGLSRAGGMRPMGDAAGVRVSG
ncbi:MAG: response regulator transcription factor [Stappiaceae bacterium]